MIGFLKWLWTLYKRQAEINVKAPMIQIPIDWKKKYVFLFPEWMNEGDQKRVKDDIYKAVAADDHLFMTGAWQLVPKENVIK